MSIFYCGCAGWSLPKAFAADFPAEGTHLERYAARFNAAEINSSFYRPHQTKTYARWAASVPEDFRFAVKIPRTITHEHRLQNATALLDRFLAEVAGLGDKLGSLLLQLPPSLSFDAAIAHAFFSTLRERCDAQLVCEPRHTSWFSAEADQLWAEFQVSRAAVDPVPAPQLETVARRPAGWDGLVYFRLHGSPIIYRSTYSPEFLDNLADNIEPKIRAGVPTWCIFDNTSEGAATLNALQLNQRIGRD